MDKLAMRKMNLLTHLAKVDGQFVKSEKKLLKQFLQERGIDESLQEVEDQPIRYGDFTVVDEKIELLYWALRMIQADRRIHPIELVFCKNMAEKLQFKGELVDYYVFREIPDIKSFSDEVKSKWSHD